MAELQIFIHPKSKPSQAVQRFFKDRGINFHQVDVSKKEPSPGEIKRFVQKYGVEKVLDKKSKIYVEEGWSYFQAGEEDWIAKMAANPTSISLPLVRYGNELSVGKDEAKWKNIANLIKQS